MTEGGWGTEILIFCKTAFMNEIWFWTLIQLQTIARQSFMHINEYQAVLPNKILNFNFFGKHVAPMSLT